jgi:hypothetical protein
MSARDEQALIISFSGCFKTAFNSTLIISLPAYTSKFFFGERLYV